jgi:hypothetical protein
MLRRPASSLQAGSSAPTPLPARTFPDRGSLICEDPPDARLQEPDDAALQAGAAAQYRRNGSAAGTSTRASICERHLTSVAAGLRILAASMYELSPEQVQKAWEEFGAGISGEIGPVGASGDQ